MPVATFNHNLIKIGKRQYRNPIYLAKEWRKALDNNEFISPADLSRHLKVSRVRVTQILNLLQLSPEVIEIIYSLGYSLAKSIISERKLRLLLGKTAEKQVRQIKILLLG
jgi:biotin operon repressor